MEDIPELQDIHPRAVDHMTDIWNGIAESLLESLYYLFRGACANQTMCQPPVYMQNSLHPAQRQILSTYCELWMYCMYRILITTPFISLTIY